MLGHTAQDRAMTYSGSSRPLSEPPDWSDPRVPLVVLDLASVETYLLVHLLSRTISEPGGAVWCPLESGPAELDRDRSRAERQAAELDFSVKWPRAHWRPVPRAMRVAALAMARGCAEPYIRTMSRMAFAAAMDVNEVSAPIQPERCRELDGYYVAVDEDLGLDGTEVTLATQDSSEWDLRLKSVAAELAAIGVTSAPAIRRDGEIRVGASAILPLLAELDACLPCRPLT
jgi:2-hydroxychromene-2-carboxylate isomerase